MRAWEPTPSEVKALLPARVGPAFTDTTRPSLGDVEILIDMFAVEVEAEAGPPPPAYYDFASSVTAAGVAQHVEATFFPEQFNTSTGPMLYGRYQRLLGILRQLVSRDAEASGAGNALVGSMRTPMPYSPYGFLIVGPDTLL